jgi:antitoxin component HigA of HigAB toxin-antitoxin module
VNRTAADPVEIIVLGSTPFIQPDTLKEWQAPTVDEVMLSAGVWLENADHAAKAHPRLKTAVAIRKARFGANQRSVTFPYKESPLGKGNTPPKVLLGQSHTLETASYQKSGAGQKQYTVVYDVRLIPDINAYLEELVGELAYFAIEDRPAPAADNALDQWNEGLMPDSIAVTVRDTIRSTGLTQQSVADLWGVSRPHVTNALQGRFGLTADIVGRIKIFLTKPPPIMQESLF